MTRGKYHIAVGVPIIESGGTIYSTLERYRREMLLVDSARYETTFVIALNGERSAEFDRVKGEIERFAKAHPHPALNLIEIPVAGKNAALNAILSFCKQKNFDVLHFLDDDVSFEPGSLQKNIETLVKGKRESGAPLLAGSHFLALKQTFAELYAEKKSVIGALRAWFWVQIFSLPYQQKTKPPKFCSGASMAAFVKDLPEFPEEGIADDVFLSNYFVVINRARIEAGGFEPILKPADSKIYFRVATSLAEWLPQKRRTHIVTARASLYFDDQFEFVERYFAWPFSYLGAFRRQPAFRGCDWVKYRIYHALLNRLEREAQPYLDRGEHHDWATAHSTKRFAG